MMDREHLKLPIKPGCVDKCAEAAGVGASSSRGGTRMCNGMFGKEQQCKVEQHQAMLLEPSCWGGRQDDVLGEGFPPSEARPDTILPREASLDDVSPLSPGDRPSGVSTEDMIWGRGEIKRPRHARRSKLNARVN